MPLRLPEDPMVKWRLEILRREKQKMPKPAATNIAADK